MLSLTARVTDASGDFSEQSVGVGVCPLVTDGTDQTGAWLAWLAEFGDGTEEFPTTITLPSGRYRFDGTMRIDGRSHLRIVGPSVGDPFVLYTDLDGGDLGESNRIHVDIIRCTDVRVSFVRVEGPNDERDSVHPDYALYRSALAFEHALAIRSGCVGCAYEDCTFTEVYGDGVYVGYHNDGVANVGCEVLRVSGTYCGRQSVAVTHCDGLLLEDIDIEWGGRSGLDVEPNHAKEKVWDLVARRVSINSKFYPFVVTGSKNGELPQRKNLTFEDCTVIGVPSGHPPLQISRDPCDGFLVIKGFTDVRSSHKYGLNIPATWETVTIEDCEITTSQNTPTSYFVRVSCTGTLTVRNNTANGKPGREGFDELADLIDVVPAVYNHCGNVWAMGTQNDGECP